MLTENNEDTFYLKPWVIIFTTEHMLLKTKQITNEKKEEEEKKDTNSKSKDWIWIVSNDIFVQFLINMIPILHTIQFGPIDAAHLFGYVQAFVFIHIFITRFQWDWFPLCGRNGFIVWIASSGECGECFGHSFHRFPFVGIMSWIGASKHRPEIVWTIISMTYTCCWENDDSYYFDTLSFIWNDFSEQKFFFIWNDRNFCFVEKEKQSNNNNKWMTEQITNLEYFGQQISFLSNCMLNRN